MASDITSGRGKPCKDGVGGVKNAYFIPNIDNGFTHANSVVTGLNVGITEVFKYDLIGSENNAEEVMSATRVNGSTASSQTVNISLKKVDSETNDQMKLVVHNYPHIAIERYSGNIEIYGLEDGVDSSVTKLTGAEKGDFAGYRMVGTAMEREFAPILDAATTTAFLALVSTTNIAP